VVEVQYSRLQDMRHRNVKPVLDFDECVLVFSAR
jgi:hypothetical protein